MANPVAQVRRIIDSADRDLGSNLVLWCPGCEQAHTPIVRKTALTTGATWEWDGNVEKPTISPSLLCYSSVHRCPEPHVEICTDYDGPCTESSHVVLRADGTPAKAGYEGERLYGHNTGHTVDPPWGNCHSFIRNGQWEFLSDCAHQLAGRTVPLVPLPDWLTHG